MLVARLPIPRHLGVNARSRMTWWQRRRAVMEEAERARPVLALAVQRAGLQDAGLEGPLEVRAVVRYRRWRGDLDNIVAGLKVWLDLLVGLGALRDDGPRIVRRLVVEAERADRGEDEEVVLEVRRMEEGNGR